MKKIVIISIGFTGVLFLSGLYFLGLQSKESPKDKPIAAMVQEAGEAKVESDEAGEAVSLARTDTQGAVVIQVTLLHEESKEEGLLVFEIVMNTHSVELTQYDPATLAEIAFGQNETSEGRFVWESVNNDSHHVKGNLKWEGDADWNSKDLKLTLTGIDGVESRNFEWAASELAAAKGED